MNRFLIIAALASLGSDCDDKPAKRFPPPPVEGKACWPDDFHGDQPQAQWCIWDSAWWRCKAAVTNFIYLQTICTRVGPVQFPTLSPEKP